MKVKNEMEVISFIINNTNPISELRKTSFDILYSDNGESLDSKWTSIYYKIISADFD